MKAPPDVSITVRREVRRTKIWPVPTWNDLGTLIMHTCPWWKLLISTYSFPLAEVHDSRMVFVLVHKKLQLFFMASMVG